MIHTGSGSMPVNVTLVSPDKGGIACLAHLCNIIFITKLFGDQAIIVLN